MRKRGLKFYLSIYRKILTQDLKTKLSYRSDFIISMIGMIITNIAGFISFMILFRNFPTINGWDYYHMLFLYGFSQWRSMLLPTFQGCLQRAINWSHTISSSSGGYLQR